MSVFRILIVAALCFLPVSAMSQGTNIALGTPSFDSSQPVEISADSLSVDQATGEAVFDGNVLVVQGEVRMSAGRMTVRYATDALGATTGISELVADGGVTFVTATDAAEAARAVYSVADSSVELTGDVLLTQGATAIAGQTLVLDLTSGSGRMEGRVRTVIAPGNGNN